MWNSRHCWCCDSHCLQVRAHPPVPPVCCRLPLSPLYLKCSTAISCPAVDFVGHPSSFLPSMRRVGHQGRHLSDRGTPTRALCLYIQHILPPPDKFSRHSGQCFDSICVSNVEGPKYVLPTAERLYVFLTFARLGNAVFTLPCGSFCEDFVTVQNRLSSRDSSSKKGKRGPHIFARMSSSSYIETMRRCARRQPLVGVLSTGDEVVDPSATELGPGQIRDSNRTMLLAAAAEAGARVMDLGIARDQVRA
jgi:hypothetical protein